MPTYIGENKIIDRYLGDKFLEAAYIGDQKVYDPYTEITGYLPMIFKSRATVALKNYRIYGTSAGAGAETENLFYFDEYTIGDTRFVTKTLTLEPNTAYTMSSNAPLYNYGALIVLTNIGESASTSNSGVYEGRPITKTTDASGKINVGLRDNGSGYDLSTYKTMLIKGSTAPTSYIPPGYKIPILNTSGVTENLFDWNTVTFGKRIQWNTGNDYADATAVRSDFISVKYNQTYVCTQQVYFIGYDDQLNYLGAYSSRNNAFYKEAPSQGAISTFTNPDISCKYIKLISAGTEQVLSNVSMFVEGSVIPDHYIPHRYESNYDLMIGSTKLGAEEYVDYGEQKVYKRTENINDKPTASGGWSNVSNIPTKNENALRVRVDDIITLDSSKTYTVTVFPSTLQVAVMKLNQNGNVYNDTGWSTGNSWSIDLSYGIVITIKNQNGTEISPSNVIGVVISENPVPPQSYIPYLQPTDPPAPLPAIQTYQGENTLSSTETVGEVSVKGRIRELTYRRVEYLKSTGTQYIQTDIVPTNTTKTVLDVEFGTWKLTTHSDPERGLIGADSLSPENKSTEAYRINLSGTTNSSDERAFSFYAGYGWRAGIDCYLYNPAIPSRNILILQSNMGSWGSASISLTEAKTLREPTLPMPIFGNARLYEATGSIVRSPFKVTNMSLYNCKIYDSENALSHNLVPVEREDGELGLLDTITNKFYANAGTGTFEKGEYV